MSGETSRKQLEKSLKLCDHLQTLSFKKRRIHRYYGRYDTSYFTNVYMNSVFCCAHFNHWSPLKAPLSITFCVVQVKFTKSQTFLLIAEMFTNI